MFTCTSAKCGILYPLFQMWPPLHQGNQAEAWGPFVEDIRSVRNKQLHFPVANHFNSPSHSSDDMSILQCHNDATRRVQEQHLIFRLGMLQPNGINVDFTSFKSPLPLLHPK
eukprot:g11801.t1